MTAPSRSRHQRYRVTEKSKLEIPKVLSRLRQRVADDAYMYDYKSAVDISPRFRQRQSHSVVTGGRENR